MDHLEYREASRSIYRRTMECQTVGYMLDQASYFGLAQNDQLVKQRQSVSESMSTQPDLKNSSSTNCMLVGNTDIRLIRLLNTRFRDPSCGKPASLFDTRLCSEFSTDL